MTTERNTCHRYKSNILKVTWEWAEILNYENYINWNMKQQKNILKF